MKHPYENIAAYARWDRSVGHVAPPDVDPVVRFPFRVTASDRIVTAGSCFAQHIAAYLKTAGFNFLVTEPGHPILEPVSRALNYGIFTARFGNIYTSRQLAQLFARAYGTFSPQEDAWTTPDGRFVDPFRPTIQPGGFHSREELEIDRRQHLAAVRRAFEQLDVLIFTLGLTECWTAAADGAAFPVAPGVAGGCFDPDRYAFVNLGVDDVVRDMEQFIDALRTVNAAARVILTVSPVPLMATAIDRHVLVSTTYSKSVLRVAAETLARSRPDVAYFPSYEIVTGAFSRGRYFADDLRSVTAEGVDHVMRLFFRHAAAGDAPQLAPPATPTPKAAPASDAARALEVLCDEELLAFAERAGDSRRA